jgi:hypothetical protein
MNIGKCTRISLRLGRLALAVAVISQFSSCAVVALPCRLASATLKVIPVVGHPAAAPFDACASAID